MDYPDFISSTGYGTGEGLKGWNCRHDFYPFFPGISEPTYTEEQLANIDPPPIEYNGKTLTYYECTQKQRAMETAMRKTKREIIAAEASDDEDMLTAKSILLRRQREEYAKFSKEAGLLTQNERTQVYGFGKSVAQKARWKAQKALDNGGGSGILNINGGSINGYTFEAVDTKFVGSDNYKKQFRGLFDSEIFNSKIENYATKALKYNDNKPSETLFAIPTSLNPLLKEKRIDKKHYWDEKYFKNGKEINLAKELMKIKHKFVVVHNHPNNTSLSLEDLFALNDVDNMEAIISIGHNGKICSVKKKKCFSDKLEREFFEMAYARNVSNYGYTNEAIKHFCEEVGWIYDI